jgi:hypothetical protein
MATVGSILQVIPATWVNDTPANQYPIQRSWQWTKNGVDIPGAVGGVYTLQTADIGSTISVREVAGFISSANNGSTLEIPAVTATATATSVSVTGSALSSLLVQPSNLVYQGSFLMPIQFQYEAEGMAFNASGFGGQKTITATIREVSGTIFSSGEVSIPALRSVTDLASISLLETAELLRPTPSLVDPTEGLRTTSGVDGSAQGPASLESKGGGIASDSKYIFSYLTNWITSQAYSVFYRRPASLSVTGSVEGPFTIIDPTYQTNPRWTGGNMCAIPSTLVGGVNYQTALGGDFLAGANGLSNIETLSDGPSAISFSSSAITATLATSHSGTAQGGTTNTIRLADSANDTNGYYVGQYIVAPSACTGARRISAYVGATRTATIEPNRVVEVGYDPYWNIAAPTSSTTYKTTPYVSGRQLVGYLPYYTGVGGPTTPLDDGWQLSTNKFPSIWGRQALAFGMAIPNGTKSLLFVGYSGDGYNNYGTTGGIYEGTRVYDPESPNVHGYPYSGKIWAYNLDELAAVYANPGVVGFNSVKPYAVFNFSLPGAGAFALREARGVTYDPSTRLLYISQRLKDVSYGGYGYGRVVVHAYLVNNAVVA